MIVEILKPWRQWKAGDVVDVPDHTGMSLVGSGHAQRSKKAKGKVSEPKPAKAEAAE